MLLLDETNVDKRETDTGYNDDDAYRVIPT